MHYINFVYRIYSQIADVNNILENAAWMQFIMDFGAG